MESAPRAADRPPGRPRRLSWRPPYSLAILLRNRNRYLPAVLAVAFSAALISLQGGLLLGLLIFTSLPIDRSSADIWVTTADADSLTLAKPIPESWLLRLSAQPEVRRAETYLLEFAAWQKLHRGTQENCCIIGFRLDEGSLGAIREIPVEVRELLSEPGTVLIDELEMPKLGVERAGDVAEINHTRVRVAGTVRGFRGFTAPYVFCSIATARLLLPVYQKFPDLTMHVLASCSSSEQAAEVVSRLRAEYPDMGVYTAGEFSLRSRVHWLFRSSAGTVMVCTVVLALLVGLVVTRQTLYSAAVAALREHAVLDALGIPRWRLVLLVLEQSWWIGLAGLALAVPLIYSLGAAAGLVQTLILLPWWLMAFALGITFLMVLVSGVSALGALRQVEPATLLR
jgi:putative ABC transport system permease protein